MKALDLRGLIPAPVTPFTRDGAVDYAAIQRLGSWLGSVAGVKGLTVLGHAGEGTFLERDEQAKVIEAFKESVGGRMPIIAGITLEGTQVAAEEAKRAVKAGAVGGPGLSVARLAALRLPEGRAAGPLSRDLRGKRPAADPVPVPGRDQGHLQPRDAARDRRAARRVRDEERRAQHEALGHRDPRDPQGASGPADPDLPRRVPAAHDVRRRRRAGRLRRHRARAAGRDDRGRQGQGLQEGARAARPPAAGDGATSTTAARTWKARSR